METSTERDHHLLRSIAEDDTSALQTLYTRHGGDILNYLKGMVQDKRLAEEILQDVMVVVWQNASTFRGDSKVRTWLFGIARNKALQAIRDRNAYITVPFNINISKAIDNKIAKVELYLVLEKAFEDLTAMQREVIDLKFYHGFKMAEIAEILGIPLGTVQSRLHSAIKQLRRSLVNQGVSHA